ncbi:MAG: molybdopterin-dependent oxidoreductase, partial [Planctomycetaceae bacterium]
TGPKGSGQFERITWDEALDQITSRFRSIATGPDGPQAILPYSYCGTMGKIQSESLDRRFFGRLGASLLDRTICAAAGGAGYRYTIGSGQGTDPEAFPDSRCIINWGSNTSVTNSHLWAKMVHARKHNSARIITMDPHRSPTAKRSDWHLAPRPGTDAALALGMMHVIFRDDLQDDEYLELATIGAEALRHRVLQEYPPERVADITGLNEQDIELLAHQYASISPAVIRVNYGLQRHAGGGMAVRTLACLPAVIGAWRHHAGGILLSTSALFPLNLQGLQRPDLVPDGTRTINMVQLAEALHGELPGPPVSALYVYNSNPASVCPDQGRVLTGLLREDLFTVVHEQFPTDTVQYADIVLPASMSTEHLDIHHAYGHPYLQLNEPAMNPPGECRCNTDVFRALASRLKFDPEVFQISDRDLAREALWENHPAQPAALTGITVSRLSESGPVRLNLPQTPPFAAGRFPTPSGRCELYSSQLEELGFDPLPTWHPPAESHASDPELAADFPLQLVSPPGRHFLNSTFNEVDSLRKLEAGPRIELARDDAAARGIRDGCQVR